MNYYKNIKIKKTKRFYYYQYHQKECNAKNYEEGFYCDCLTYFSRWTRTWYKPIEYIGKYLENKFWGTGFAWWIRKNICVN